MNLNYGSVTNLSFLDRVKLQFLKHIENTAEEKVISERFTKWFSMGNDFVLDGDKELSKEQIKEIDKFWERYKFAYPKICYNEFKAYMNRTGIFSPYYIPAGIRTIFIAPYLQHKHYYWSEQNKTLLNKIFNNIKQPVAIVRRMNGYFYDGNYNRINLPIAVKLCLEHLSNGKEFIWKPNDVSGGGRGIRFFKTATEKELSSFFTTGANSFVVQDVMKQHIDMEKLNPYAVNTLRITSIIWKNEVVVLGAVLRTGTSEKRVDNWSAGGLIVGVDKNTGLTLSWGSDKKNNKSSVTFGGVQLSNGYQIPSWEKVIDTVKRAHHNIPYIKLASWDIAIDEIGDPTLIEVNFAGDWHVHQLTTGPMLGELTKEILDKAILENYYKKHATLNFDYKEFYDHIIVEKYLGNSSKVVIPEMMYGKPVTVIGKRAFRFNKSVKEVVLPNTIKVIGERAFSGCVSLEKINVPIKATVHKTAFIDCPVTKK